MTKAVKNETIEKNGVIEELIEKATNKVIAIDCGKNNMKAMYKNDVFIYSNKIDFKYGDTLNNLTWNVEYKGEQYFVGDGATDSDLAEGKSSTIHKVQALTAIANFLDPNEKNDDIVVVYGESVDFYFQKENKDSIVKNLEGKHSMIVNGVERDLFVPKYTFPHHLHTFLWLDLHSLLQYLAPEVPLNFLPHTLHIIVGFS